MEERLKVWFRDFVKCIKELMGNPMFRNVMKYVPERQFKDVSKTSEVINEMWTGSCLFLIIPAFSAHSSLETPSRGCNGCIHHLVI